MIVDVWIPKYSKVGGVKNITRYDLGDLDFFLKNKKKGWKVRYTCDNCFDQSIKVTTSHVLFSDKNSLNSLDKQTCRNCRSRISEYQIKSNFIPFEVFEKSLKNSGYQIITNYQNYNNSPKKSQFKLDVICDNGHNLKVTWNNWSKGKKCRVCYEKNKFDNAVKNKFGWERYKFLVWYYTEENYKKFKNFINPNKLKRGFNYHLDHKFSISEGFRKNLPVQIIASKENLEIITNKENCSKGYKCSISLNELIEKTHYLLNNS